MQTMFAGRLRSVLHRTGAADTVSYQPFLALPLDLPVDGPKPGVAISLAALLRSFTAPEPIVGLRHPTTNLPTPGHRRLLVETLPPVFIVQLKRFWFDANGPVKLETAVSFPAELTWEPECLFGPARHAVPRYLLRAVLVHHGGRLADGHYTAYVRHPLLGWLHCDDASLRRVGEQEVLQAKAYLLFYVQG